MKNNSLLQNHKTDGFEFVQPIITQLNDAEMAGYLEELGYGA